ncbi:MULTISPECIES: DUF2147 domain-containing protein [unclassified Chelatococcus]|uniref:DUF2147 domain-containing protein n=1 Tax=unclassified Chelatococcus TaxID=2638111 RepID=UPI001BD19697|nr:MULTISPECIES: DUF2147 domain-containing protein [unclassified Chelatococcus]CAH1655786.1 conserved exported hypothetical protein [Hyphomicrobiales bacterium]MBS7742556.1 DUF2147 domain-containing protein [Chelatococcus sp. HY11]MBX3542326.1 DUF2147 domain-containing protein [Chelatococcus sp.]MCO5075456.1 DUF2147 domain-containing protein [Chelatococcus sp.]CAH1695635.1 conserved exported hypothetical protein [Hyphomicrobiales bacterium]
MTRLLLAFALSSISIGCAAAGDLDGTWLRDDGNARVRIAPCGDKICATNLWIGDTSKGEAIGDRLIMTLARQSDGTFSGNAYDPKRDWTYAITITVTGDALVTRGCILGRLLCRDVTWRALD